MADINVEQLKADLVRDEGKARQNPAKPGRLFPYLDSKGIESIGVGRNLRDRGVSDDEAMMMLGNDINDRFALLDRELPWWRQMDEVRQRALANLAFNLGVGPTPEDPDGKLLTFKGTLQLLQSGDYNGAATHLEATPWYNQVGPRALRIVSAIRNGAG